MMATGLLDYLEAIGETGATLGSGAAATMAGIPYGIMQNIRSGKYGTKEGVKLADKATQDFIKQYTYAPRGQMAQNALQSVAGLMDTAKLPPVLPEAGLLAAIPKATYASQFERAGMAAERALEPVAANVMARGGLPAQLLQDLTQGTVRPLDVYHGTPNKLPPTQTNLLGEFDASKIGTGAGAQARGYGIYSSESPEFADYFALRKTVPDVEGIALQNGLQLSRDAQIELMRQATRDSAGKPVKADNYIDPISAVRKLQNASIEARQMPVQKLQNTIRDFQDQNKAYLYKADLPDEMISKMLDLDAPIKDQPMALKAIRQMIDDQDILRSFDHNVSKGITGENASINYVKGKTPAERSENLRKAGIPGNVYKEFGDVRNFVVYPGEEKRMKILERKTR